MVDRLSMASKWSEVMGDPWVAFFHELEELQKSSSEINLNQLKRALRLQKGC